MTLLLVGPREVDLSLGGISSPETCLGIPQTERSIRHLGIGIPGISQDIRPEERGNDLGRKPQVEGRNIRLLPSEQPRIGRGGEDDPLCIHHGLLPRATGLVALLLLEELKTSKSLRICLLDLSRLTALLCLMVSAATRT